MVDPQDVDRILPYRTGAIGDAERCHRFEHNLGALRVLLGL